MAIRKIRDAEEAKKIIGAMTDHSYDARSVFVWIVDRVSELERRLSKLEHKDDDDDRRSRSS